MVFKRDTHYEIETKIKIQLREAKKMATVTFRRNEDWKEEFEENIFENDDPEDEEYLKWTDDLKKIQFTDIDDVEEMYKIANDVKCAVCNNQLRIEDLLANDGRCFKCQPY